MKVLRVSTLAGSALAIALMMGSTSASAITLPSGTCGLNFGDPCLTEGDFSVYSLALLNFYATGGTPKPGDPYYVNSSPGYLDPLVVLATGTNGQAPINTDLGPGIDNAFDSSPNPAVSTTPLPGFVTSPEPAPTFPGDIQQAWDITHTALTSYLGAGNTPIFFFNLNEDARGDANLLGQDLLAWMQIQLYNNGSPVGSPFTLTQNIFDPLYPGLDWAYVHGDICISPTAGVLFGPCPSSGIGSDGTTVNQNLGANNAAFAIQSSALNSALSGLTWDIMSVSMRLAYTDNGYEQVFMANANQVTNAPEPGTLPLFGVALLALGFLGRRTQTAAKE